MARIPDDELERLKREVSLERMAVSRGVKLDRRGGAAIRERLQRLGILRESGHEHLNGSVVVPVFDEGAVSRRDDTLE